MADVRPIIDVSGILTEMDTGNSISQAFTLPDQAAAANQVLKSNGTVAAWAADTAEPTHNLAPSEALTAGNMVNIFNNSPTIMCRKADNSNTRPADGFVKAAFATTETATIFSIGSINTAVSGLLTTLPVFLGTAGGFVQTSPSGANIIVQRFSNCPHATTAFVLTNLDYFVKKA